MPSSTSLPTTLLFLALFIPAFFPTLFPTLLHLPLRPFLSFLSPTPPSPPPPPPHLLSPTPPTPTMSFTQNHFSLPPHARGCYLITAEILAALPDLATFRVGILHLFVQHTSCALSLNENCDEDVRRDMGDALGRIVPDGGSGGKGEGEGGRGLYRHDAEGGDDMPAHVKSALIGASVSIPIAEGKLALGTWQGVWFLEFRDRVHTRRVVATIQGERM